MLKFPWLKRWSPLIGATVLVSTVVLRVMGKATEASALEAAANTVGLTTQSPVSMTEISAAAAALAGIILKLVSEWKKARAAANTVSLPK